MLQSSTPGQDIAFSHATCRLAIIEPGGCRSSGNCFCFRQGYRCSSPCTSRSVSPHLSVDNESSPLTLYSQSSKRDGNGLHWDVVAHQDAFDHVYKKKYSMAKLLKRPKTLLFNQAMPVKPPPIYPVQPVHPSGRKNRQQWYQHLLCSCSARLLGLGGST